MKLKFEISDKDLDFIVNTAAPEAKNKEKLKQYIKEDNAFRKGLIGNDKVFARIMGGGEVFLDISPRLLFEILLRRGKEELKKRTWTFERVGYQKLPVFDISKASDLLEKESILEYLADMLSSFTKIESYTVAVRVRKGVWRKIRFNDMDIDSLKKLCQVMDEEHRFSIYKRIADVCLFVMGVFPEYVMFDYRYSSSGKVRSKLAKRIIRSAEEYETDGRKFYKLASEHEKAHLLDLAGIFTELSENFNLARRCLDFITQQYLHFTKHKFFDVRK